MIKVSITYANAPGATFDMAYYAGSHQALVKARCGDALLRQVVCQGVAGAVPGSPPPFLASVDLFFDSIESFQASFAPHIPEFMADIPNFTNATLDAFVGHVVE